MSPFAANDLRLRYPEGIRSVVDMDLAVRGNVRSPTLAGLVTVKNALWNRRIDTPGNLFDLAGRRSTAGAAPSSGAEQAAAFPLKFDVQILVPSTLRVENNLVRMVANADLMLRGTYDRPVISGHADIDRGEVTFEGRRYRITRGIDGLHESHAHRAVLRRRGRDQRAGDGADLSGHGGLRRDAGPDAADAELRSVPAGLGRAGAAVQRRAAHRTTPSCARDRTPIRRRRTS